MGSSKKDPDAGLKLKKSVKRDLKRQLKEIKDPRRYLVASVVAKNFVFFYIAESDAYSLDPNQSATAFKSKKVAKGVLESLGSDHTLVKAVKRKNGRLRVVSKL